MKKYIIYTILAISTLASCQKNLIDETPAISSAQTLIVSVQPNDDEPQSRVALTDGASNVTLDWESDDSFTLYTTDGERVVDFKYASESNGGRILFTSADENIKLSDNENYIAIYPAVEGVTTLDAHRTELESRLAEQTQTGNNSNSHLENALRMEAEFTYSASSDTKVTFEHQMATMRLTFASENGTIPTKIIFSDGDFMSYTVNLDGVTKASTYTAHFVITPNENGLTRELGLTIVGENYTGMFSIESEAVYSAGVQYRSELSTDDFSTYDGMLIYTKADLIAFRDAVNGGENDIDAKLMADIDLKNEEWTPIGTSDLIYYVGDFDGKGHVISNLTINSNDNKYQGLFGYVYSGSISNLTLKDSYIASETEVSTNYTGIICGHMESSSILNCSIEEGSIEVNSTAFEINIGGMIGYAKSSSISSCNNTSMVTGSTVPSDISYLTASYIGGIVGCAESTSISYCYNDEVVTGSDTSNTDGFKNDDVDIVCAVYTGGIVGYTDSQVTFCYNNGDVIGNSCNAPSGYIGGVVGYTTSSIENCHNTGNVEGRNPTTNNTYYADVYIGGVVGYITSTVSDCYNDGDISGSSRKTAYVGGVIGYTTSTVSNCQNMKTVTISSTPNGYSGGVVGYGDHKSSVSNCYNSGSVTGSSFANSSSPTGCSYVYVGGVVGQAEAVSSCYNTADISSRSSISLSPAVAIIVGSYTGGVAGYTSNISDCYNTGNLTVNNSSSSTYPNIGGVVGYTYHNILDCYNTGDIVIESSAETEIGGVAGYSGGRIESCHNEGDVTNNTSAYSCIGGVIGNTNTITYIPMSACYNTGKIKNSSTAALIGGVVGNLGISIEDCYNTGDMLLDFSSNGTVGGIVGNKSKKITHCKNSGKITIDVTGSSSSSNTYIGGISGSGGGDYCCNEGDIEVNSVASVSIFVGGISRYSDSKSCYNIGNITVDSSSDSFVGGVAAYALNSSYISCYNKGDVTVSTSSKAYAGGVVGALTYPSSTSNYSPSSLSCYNTGDVMVYNASDAYAGGIAGYANSYSYITSCYSMGNVSSSTSSNTYIGGVAGVSCNIESCSYLPCSNTAYTNSFGTQDPNLISTMKSQEIISTLNIAAGESYWTYDSNNVNDGYPILVNIDYQ